MFFRLCRPKKSVVNNQFCTCNTREPTDNKLTGVVVFQQNFLYKSRWQVYLACSHSLTGFPAGISGKEPAYSAGDLKDRVQYPGGGKWLPTPVFLAGESHGQRSLEGYNPQGHKESDTAETT